MLGRFCVSYIFVARKGRWSLEERISLPTVIKIRPVFSRAGTLDTTGHLNQIMLLHGSKTLVAGLLISCVE